jgi:3',5'-cyclic-AMP phosphodiesterase
MSNAADFSLSEASSDWIAILADVHVGEERSTKIRHSGASELLLAEAVEKIQQIGIGKTILLGDTVNQGWDSEYLAAKQILEPLHSQLEPVLGNHELQRGGFAEFTRMWGVDPVRQIRAWGMPALILNSGIEGLPDTRWNGRLDEQQLRQVDEFLEAYASMPVTIFCHHPLAHSVRGSDEPMLSLDNSDELRTRLRRHTQQVLLLTGHTHCQSIVRQENLICIGCPSLCFWPHAFLVGERMGDEIRISTVRVRDDEYTSDARATGAEQLTYRSRNEGTGEDRRSIIRLK